MLSMAKEVSFALSPFFLSIVFRQACLDLFPLSSCLELLLPPSYSGSTSESVSLLMDISAVHFTFIVESTSTSIALKHLFVLCKETWIRRQTIIYTHQLYYYCLPKPLLGSEL
jgi:hypothetical protein